jgi:hypothetical protein
MAPPPEEGVVAELSLATLAGLNADEPSEPDAQGDGRGLSGEIMDADEDSVETTPLFRPPMTGILRVSSEDGLRNSDGRRWRGGLGISKPPTDSFDFVNGSIAHLKIGIPPIDILSLRGLGGAPSFDLPLTLPLREEPEAVDVVSQLPPKPSPRMFELSLDVS